MSENETLNIALRCLSHEIGNYLSPATMLLNGFDDDLEGEDAEDARDIIKAVDSVAELLSVLRELSMMFAGSLPGRVSLLELSERFTATFPESEAISIFGRKLEIAYESQSQEKENEHACMPSP